MSKDTRASYYGKYLEVDTLLNLQKPLSDQEETPAHDEMLFIIIHQTYELWFKQILHELDSCMDILNKEKIDDDAVDMSVMTHRMKRIVEIGKLLNHQIDVLETMTPMDFLDFRHLFSGASGFQSRQFRLVEAKLGLRMDSRHAHGYYKRTNEGGFDKGDLESITHAEDTPTFLDLVIRWLERLPVFESAAWQDWGTEESDSKNHPFWVVYRELYSRSLSSQDQYQQGTQLSVFDKIFFEEGQGRFSSEAMRAALFIMLFRDQPLFRLPYQILSIMLEIDEQIATWRYRHLQMVRRMIGMRVGTGGTSGQGYLEGAVNQNYIYRELSSLTTFLIERRYLPQLPEALRANLGFRK